MIDDDSDGVADRVNTVLKRLFVPNGIAYRNGSLYVATVTDVLRYDDVDRLALSGKVRSFSTFDMMPLFQSFSEIREAYSVEGRLPTHSSPLLEIHWIQSGWKTLHCCRSRLQPLRA